MKALESRTSIHFNAELPDNIIHSSEAVFQTFVKGTEKILELQYSRPTRTSNSRAYHQFAHIEVEGEIVARVYNNGFADIPSDLNDIIQDQLLIMSEGLNGPQLAHVKTQYLANALAGTIVIADSSMTQRAFEAMQKPAIMVDYDAMANDPMYEKLQEIQEARRNFMVAKIFS